VLLSNAARFFRPTWIACIWLGAAPLAAQVVDDPPPTAAREVEVQRRVEQAFETQELVRVFVILREGEASLGGAQQAVLDSLGSNFDLWHRYRNIHALAGELSRAGLAQLRKHPAVSAVQLDGTGSGGLAEALPATGVDKLQSVRGLSGKGVTVAVLDSGASSTHPALMGAIVAQHCFTQGGCPPLNSREGESAEDDHNHGSNVTGIVGSRGGGGIAKGYAPGASLVPVKVLNRNNAGQISDWVAGFDWVLTNLPMLKVKVINASLVSTAEYANAADCDRSETALAAVTKKLIAAGVTITGSSGNTGHTMTMTAPSCNTGVIAVGATYDTNLGNQPESGGTYRDLGGGNWPACKDMNATAKTIACFTSTAGARLDLLAPGTQIASVGRGTGRSLFRGTSQAAPGVAGLAALLLECNPMLTPDKILSVLKMTGEPVMDPRTGMMYPLIRGVEAADAACGMGMSGGPGVVTAAGMGGLGAGGAGGVAPIAGMAGSVGGALAAGSGAAGTAAGTGGPVGAGSLAAGGGSPLPAGNSGSLASGSGGPGRAGAFAPAGAAAPVEVPRVAEDDSGCSCSTPGAHGSSPSGALFCSAVGLAWFATRRRRRTSRTR
jgi:MYXO-CTERM domain-containing protein